MSKKGFTLIELLVVVAILVIMTLGVVPNLVQTYNKAKDKEYEIFMGRLYEATRVYVENNIDEIEGLKDANSKVIITLQDIVNSGLLREPLRNPKTNKNVNLNSPVIVTRLSSNNFDIEILLGEHAFIFLEPIIDIHIYGLEYDIYKGVALYNSKGQRVNNDRLEISCLNGGQVINCNNIGFNIGLNQIVYSYDGEERIREVNVKVEEIYTPVITVSPSSVTYNPVNVSITYGDYIAAKNYYKIDNGDWIEYTGTFVMSDNGIVSAKTVGVDGTTKANEYVIKNIIPEGWLAIETAEDLYNIRNNLTGKYILIKNINLTGTAYDPWTPITNFGGSLDGNGFIINGLKTTGTSSYRGLFGTITGANVEIKNLTLTNASVSGSSKVGIIAGEITGANPTINNVTVTGTIPTSGQYAGGLVGYTNQVITIDNCDVNVDITSSSQDVGGLIGYGTSTITITDSYNRGNVSGTKYIGGLIGRGTSTVEITNVNTTGTVTGSSDYVGGLIGQATGVSTITGSYTIGDISGGQYVGGLIGVGTSGSINNSYTTGTVTGTSSYVGGLIGNNDNTAGVDISSSYATGDIQGSRYVGGLAGRSYYSTIEKSYASGNVTATYTSTGYAYVGGLIGRTYSGTVTNVYALGDVTSGTSTTAVGGLIGYNKATVTNVYAIGKIIGPSTGAEVGPIIGYQSSGTLTGLFWDKDTSGITSGNYGTGKTTVEMQTQSTFVNWDFVDTWQIITGNYPSIRGLIQ